LPDAVVAVRTITAKGAQDSVFSIARNERKDVAARKLNNPRTEAVEEYAFVKQQRTSPRLSKPLNSILQLILSRRMG
jgi:hypothetical protein